MKIRNSTIHGAFCVEEHFTHIFTKTGKAEFTKNFKPSEKEVYFNPKNNRWYYLAKWLIHNDTVYSAEAKPVPRHWEIYENDYL